MEGIRQLFRNLEGPDETNSWPRLSHAAGGTSDGVLKLLHDREQLYNEMEALCSLPYRDFQKQLKELSAHVENSDNPFSSASLPAFGRSRIREFRILAELAMVRAAIEYKLHGEPGLKSVTDPCGEGPFALKRFVFEGKDRGFELKSAYEDGGARFALIFVDQDGPPFYVDGPRVGQGVKVTDEEEAMRKRYGLDSRKK
jgi:hypothetical protein